MLLYALTIFLSAFLLFQVQPLIAKIILAWFGGSASVWTTCMLFFQAILLLGYFYSHLTISRLKPRQQAILHTALLGLAAVLLPIIPAEAWKPSGLENPTLRILGVLAATVGLPYLLCSTTGPLVQAWYARREGGGAPYRLFALSNLGSMLALLSYPVLVEPTMAIRAQAWAWSAGFVGFAALCIATGWRSAGHTERQAESAIDDGGPAPGFNEKLLWIGLAACPSLLLLAVTNHLTQDVASIPFLWVLPLALYLLSFILTFDARGWYNRNVFLVLMAPALGGMAYMQWSNATLPDFKATIALFAVCFFVACMVCHGELAGRKPAARHLTSFYLMLSVGGALGGLFTGVVAPYLFISYFELPVGIGLCGLLAILVSLEEPGLTWRDTLLSAGGLALALGVLGLWVFLGKSVRDAVGGYKVVTRNFYGTLRVKEGQVGEYEAYRSLLHGSINHGEQWLHPDRRREMLSYYCPESGIGRVMSMHPKKAPWRVGVIGLGAGTMAAFGESGDYVSFYEINPLVPRLANSDFSYLPDSAKRGVNLEVKMGDGRLTLERESPQRFDVLMVDAFSGDSIPVHLLTREAFQLYFRHIAPEGLLVVHISNKYLNLQPVVDLGAQAVGRVATVLEADDNEDETCYGTTYVVVGLPHQLEHPAIRGGASPAKIAGVRAWTDDYSNLFRILK
jgi:spermidine synthase